MSEVKAKKLFMTIAAALFFSAGAAAADRPPIPEAPAEPISPVPFLLRLSSTKIVSIKPLIEESGFLIVYYREKDRVLVTEYFGEGAHPEAYYDAVILRPELAEYYRLHAVDVEKVLKEFRNYEQKLKEYRREQAAQAEAPETSRPSEETDGKTDSGNPPFKTRVVRKPKK
jgi:hypothetical protein